MHKFDQAARTGDRLWLWEIGLAIFSGATQVAILQGFGEKWPLMDPYLRSQESHRHVVRQWYAWMYTENWNRGMARRMHASTV